MDPSKLKELMARYDRINGRFIADGGHTFETKFHEIVGGLGFGPDHYALPVGVLSGGQICRVSLAKLLLQEKRTQLDREKAERERERKKKERMIAFERLWGRQIILNEDDTSQLEMFEISLI